MYKRGHGHQMKTYSQDTQDGILQVIFRAINTTNRHAVEFGFGYVASSVTGKALLRHHSGLNTRLLMELGWNVTYFDALVEDAEIPVRRVVLSEENIAREFRAAGVPTEADYVSVDVDSTDIWLLRALLLDGYRPRVVSIEYNPNWGANDLISCAREWAPWNGTSVFGVSAAAIDFIGSEFGYRTVHVMLKPALDVFLVRADIVDVLCDPGSLPSFIEMTQPKPDLAQPGLPIRVHHTGHVHEVERLVWVPLELKGHHRQAQARALETVLERNTRWPDNPLCDVRKRL